MPMRFILSALLVILGMTAVSGQECDPNYAGACVPNVWPADVDCLGGEGDGPYYTDGTQLRSSELTDMASIRTIRTRSLANRRAAGKKRGGRQCRQSIERVHPSGTFSPAGRLKTGHRLSLDFHRNSLRCPT
jgi:hypothetical protein